MTALLIKASLVLIVLLAFYKLFLEKESFFAANRIYLLGCLFVATTLPFIGLPELVKNQGIIASLLKPAQAVETPFREETIPPVENPIDDQENGAIDVIETAPENAIISSVRKSPSTQPDFNTTPSTSTDKIAVGDESATRGFTYWLILLYCFGVAVLTLKFLAQIIYTVWKIYRTEDKIPDEDSVLVNMHGEIDPCSFFKYIFINPASYDYETYEQIIAHERIHVRKWHTLDLLLSEIAVIALWFNPFVWLLRREVEKNIEYQTDDLMVRSNIAARESYQLNLLKIATYTEPLTITTNYNQSLIKKRILKMNAKRSNRNSYLKYAFVVPMLFGLTLVLNEPAQGNGHTAALAETQASNANQFYSTQDTLILQTEKYPGYGMFSGGFGSLFLEAIPEDDDRLKMIPAGISDAAFGQDYIDLKVWQYESLKKDKHEYLGEFLEKWYPEKIDTANLPSLDDNTVKVLVGKQNGEKIYIVDQNNNLDFRDDPVRSLKKINWKAMEAPVSCHYRIYNGEEIMQDSSWVYIGLFNDDQVWISAAQHLRSTFSIDEQNYTVRVFNDAPMMRWCFENPQISITAQNGVEKDSLVFRDKFELGEYLKFDNTYYRFADVSNDGRTITLIRVENSSNIISAQAGFIAPDFSAVTTNGDSVTLSDYRGQYLLLANMAAICLAPERTYGQYKDTWANYHDKMAIVGIDYSPDDIQQNMDRLQLEGTFVISKDNSSIEDYRDFHCSEICFLIDPAGRVVDRFEIADWSTSLAKYFK
ncbi:MAG: M56 family metallopeptidase [Saprospiraceae bacterium]|nr:redoxin domain-containing protein [Lewinella sp.]